MGFAVAAALQPPPTFRATTDLVEVDLVAQDRNGRFVSDLRADDFEVREDGAPQHVELMYLVGGAAASAVSTSAAAGGANPAAGPSAAASATPTRPRPPRVFIALFDNDHLNNSSFKRVQAAANELFAKQFGPGDIGGVVVDRHLVHDRLTTDREELLAAVHDARPGQRAAARKFDETLWPRLTTVEAIRIVLYRETEIRSAAIQRACIDDPTQCPNAPLALDGKAAQLVAEVQGDTVQTMQTIAVLLRGLARVDGRKTILLMTEGFYADIAWPLVKESIGEAAMVNARVYTLDARGLDRTGMAEYLSGAFSGDNHSAALNMLKQFDYSEDAMNSLAVDTGGFVVRNQNYFDKAIAQIVADASTYYVLAYRPQKAPDGKFRSISVKVKRPGVLIRARRGYVATAKPAVVTTEARPSTSSGRAESGSPRADTTSSGRAETVTEPAASVPARGEPVEPRAGAAPSANAAAEPTPALTPDTARPEPVEGRAANVTAAPGFRFRPDATKHVDLLLKDEAGDVAAKAGWDAYQRGDVATARASLAVAAESPSAHPWVHYALGLSEYALREFKASASEWEAVRRAEPAFEPVYFDLVDSYLQLREHDEAIKVLRSARDHWPQDPEVYNALGVIQTSRGVVDDAVKAFQQAVTLAPQDPVGHFNLGRALEMRYNRTRRYVRQLERWVSNERDRTDAIEQYKACITLGGPFAPSAQEGVARLNWKVQ